MIEIFRNKNNIKFFLLMNILVSLAYFLFKNLSSSLELLSLSIFSFQEKIKLFFLNIFDTSELQYIWMLILVLLFIVSLSFFLLLIKLFLKESRKISKGKSFWSSFWVFVTVLGLSCISCGIGILSSFLSFFGISSLVLLFPLHGLELGYLGVIALNINNYFLLKRLKNPFVC